MSDESLWASNRSYGVSFAVQTCEDEVTVLWVEVRGVTYAKVTSIHRMSRLLVASDDIRRLSHCELKHDNLQPREWRGVLTFPNGVRR